MTAELLRRAAALMRERAEKATPGPWLADGAGGIGSFAETLNRGERGVSDDMSRRDARHVASWHPAVALAVADWLAEVAGRHRPIHGDEYRRALAVARAYLGADQ